MALTSWLHNSNTSFTDDGVKKYTETDFDITQRSMFPFTDRLNFNLTGFIFLCNSYGNHILLKKPSNGGHYGGVPRKEVDRTEDSYLLFFNEEIYYIIFQICIIKIKTNI